VVWQLFLSEQARKETNLQFVQDKILGHPDRQELLALYERVVRGKRVGDDVQSPIQNQLKLSGLVKAEGGRLRVRNRIYRQVFGRKWIRTHMPVDWARRIAIVSTLLLLLLAGVVFVSLRLWGRQTVEAQARTAAKNFREIPSADVRVTSLADLFQLAGYEAQAWALFYELPPEAQIDLFVQVDPQKVGARRLVTVVQCLYSGLEDDAQGNALLHAMAQPLRALDDPAAHNLAAEIEQWRKGRDYAAQGRYQQALVAYDAAIGLNDRNPRTFFERGLAYAALGEAGPALDDLEIALGLGRTCSYGAWEEWVQGEVIGDERLLVALWREPGAYPGLSELAPTPVALQAGDVLYWAQDRSTMAYVPGVAEGALLLDPFWIDEHEVTNAQFQRFVQETGHQTHVEELGKGWRWTSTGIMWLPGWDWRHPQGPGSSIDGLAQHPVVLVNWNDARAYCAWAGKRLPADDEWEVAAMGSDGRRYPWGDQEPAGEYLNYCDARCPWGEGADDDGFPGTAPVCQFPRGVSPYGLCDVGGNVWEWVDAWHTVEGKRVIRGGAWSHPASDARASLRVGHEPDGALDVLGFRCARDADLAVLEREGTLTPLGVP
jgi:sulfatase modifying factor 1